MITNTCLIGGSETAAEPDPEPLPVPEPVSDGVLAGVVATPPPDGAGSVTVSVIACWGPPPPLLPPPPPLPLPAAVATGALVTGGSERTNE